MSGAERTRRYRARQRGEYVEPVPGGRFQRSIVIQDGQRFGRLTVVREIPLAAGQRRCAECICDCGVVKAIRLSELASGGTRSCGCLHRALSAESLRRVRPDGRTHGLHSHPLYKTWSGMIARCENPATRRYPDYGGRGVRICEAWHDAAVFIAWIEANLGPRPTGRNGKRPAFSLDRIDNDGNYEPGNVRWATASQQMSNQRRQRRQDGAA